MTITGVVLGAGAGGHNMVLDLMHTHALDWLRAGVIFVGSLVAAWLLRRAVRRWLHRGNCEVGVADLIARFVGFAMVLLGVVYALMALHVQVGPLLGALGVGGLAVALAAKNLLEDLFGGFVLQARHPFRRGDEVVVAGEEGLVEDINLRTVVVRSHDGERFFIPSSAVLGAPIVNLTADAARRSVLIFSVPFATDLDDVTAALRESVGHAEGVLAEPPVLAQVRAVGETGVEVAVKFWHSSRVAEQHQAVHAAGQAALAALARLAITCEVPQRRVLTGAY
jgi:small conductance mechanosensitive channel